MLVKVSGTVRTCPGATPPIDWNLGGRRSSRNGPASVVRTTSGVVVVPLDVLTVARAVCSPSAASCEASTVIGIWNEVAGVVEAAVSAA